MNADVNEPPGEELMAEELIVPRDVQVLELVFKYLKVDSLKVCRLVNKCFQTVAIKWLIPKSQMRLNNSLKIHRFLQAFPGMQTPWESYKITLYRAGGDLVLRLLSQIEPNLKVLYLEIKCRDTALVQLEDIFSQKMATCEELTINGRFPPATTFPNPHLITRKMTRLKVFNIFAYGWHRCPPMPNGEVPFRNPLIGQILSGMPNVQKINYFPDADSAGDAHKHYGCFLYNISENENVVLRHLKELENFSVSFANVSRIKKFAAKGYPLEKLNMIIEEGVEPSLLTMFLNTFRHTLVNLVIRSATDSTINWPRLPKLETLACVAVNFYGTDVLTLLPSLKWLHVSQDRLTSIDFAPEKSLALPHTLTSLKIMETIAVTGAPRLTNEGLSIIFKDLPGLVELVISQHIDSEKPSFSDDGIVGARMSISLAHLSTRPRDLRQINSELIRFAQFIGNLRELKRLTLKSPTITDVSLLLGIVNCPKLNYLEISSPNFTEKACLELFENMQLPHVLRIQDFGGFTSAGKSSILVRMKFQEVFYANKKR